MSVNISEKKDHQISTDNQLPVFTDAWQKTLYQNTFRIDSIQSQSTSPTIERDKMNHQLTIEIFDRLLKFGNETDRPLFCQRLQVIWEEQGIFCQTHPTITSQILDLYKLHHIVQEKQGYLEITTNRGWKEISNVLGFGDSGSAAYSVKRNYVRLGLLAYECRFDRAGIDPRSVIELSEMPHTVKKRKRGNHTSSTTTRTVIKNNKQQLQTHSIQHEYDDLQKPLILPKDVHNPSKYSSYYQNISPLFRLTPQQMPINDFQHIPFLLRAGYLADSNKYLDTLLVWLSDPYTASYFNLKSLSGLFNSIMEQYIACLYELFDQSFLQPSSTNDYYINWFLELKLRINDSITGPKSNEQRLESLFFGTHRYVLQRLMTKSTKPRLNNINNHKQHTDRYHSIMIRCSCLSTIIRNLSFIEENEYLANDRCLLDILERILNYSHYDMHKIFNYHSHVHENNFDTCSNCSNIISDDKITMESTNQNDFFQKFTEPSTDMKIVDDPLACTNDCNLQHLMYLLDNTFITLSNLSTSIEFRYYYSITRYRFINTIIHWILCLLSFANEPFISMILEDKFSIISSTSNKKNEQIYISPRDISLQILAKLCINEINVDYILLDLDSKQLVSLSHALLSIMNSSNQEDINREYCLLIICSLCKRNQKLVEFFCSHIICIELIFNYLEYYEYNQQQYLIATLTSYYNSTTTSSSNIPINHSVDMMIDSCIQLLLLFASIKENNCLKLFEYKLVDMSSSIYFEQKILKTFADILFIIKT
ncbi:unnamed protein product [Adineta steineri]|uniref:ARID domain-containing protein n=1 Tax=Adineta steineri TaxID=433720 RepID=A0A816DV98_9BILA|nr:unnamed protein product [Adineta steineri]CAF1637796.1 unnamed protein product [Adineta steineri]